MKRDFVLFTMLEGFQATEKHSANTFGYLNTESSIVFRWQQENTGSFRAEKRKTYKIAFIILAFIILMEKIDSSRKRRKKGNNPNKRLLKLIQV